MSQPAVPSTTLTTPSPKKQASAGNKKHRSVKSLTREYETNSSNTGGIPTSASSSSALSSASSAATPTALTPSSSATTAFPSSPTTAERGLSPQTSETSLSISRDRSNSQSSPSHQHLRKASAVLLASPTYPSTLNLEDHTRPRTLSSSSQYSAHDKSESSVRLASRGYPSSYMPVQAQNQAQPQQAENGALGLTRDTMSAAAAKPKDGKGAQAMLRMHRRKESKEALERERQANLASAHAEGSSSSSNGIPTLSISSEDVTQTHPSRDNSLISTSSSHEEDEELYEGLDSVGDLNSNTVNSGSSEKPFSQMTPAERREHSRRHSRVHSRNLSVFFPRPGTDAEKEADEEQARQNYLLPSSPPEQSTAHSHAAHSHLQGALSPPQMQHSESLERRASGASFVSATSSSSGSTTVGTEDMQRSMSSKSRRGHHHRHSVNFAVYDSPQMAVSTSAVGHSHHNHAHDAHERHHHEHAHTHDHAAHAHDHARSHTVNAADSFSALLSKFPPLPPSARPTLLFGSLHFALGAALWVSGQAGDSLALTGLGYLVVFDAFGVLSEVGSKMAAESWRRELDQRYKGGRTSGKTSTEQIRRPFGPHRFETILHFSQSIYLLFSGVYVLKESIEHALLEGSEEHEEAEIGLVLPVGLLMLATAACIFSNITLKNHAKLVAACGISTAASSAQNQYAGNRHARHKSVLTNPTTIAGPFLGLLANPFSLTVLFFSASLLFSAILMPPFQVAALDKVLAGMESVSMFCIAWPASKALGLVLLQTAPLSSAPQYVQLVKALQVLEEHPLVTYIAPPRIWQLTPSTSSTTSADDASRKNNSFANLTQSASRAPALIATVHIFLQDSASDDDLQAVKKLAWERLAASVGAAAGLRAGESLRGGRRAGEITIAVEREGKRDHYLSQLDHNGHHHDGHDHHHDHACDHGHDHAHEHAGHSHSHAGHAHSHDSHSHSHAPAQAHKHSHQHAHESSHAHHGHSHHDHH